MSHKEKILELRSKGYTYCEISKELGCSKATVSFHCGKRQTNSICICGKYKDVRSSKCQECSNKKRRQKLFNPESTIGDKIYDKHKYAKYSYIRYHAKVVFEELNIKSCQKCGYDKHIEVCHIKPVSSFSPETLISEVNNVENLIGLCPNCHWEMDNNCKKTDI